MKSTIKKYFDFELTPSQERVFKLLQTFSLDPNSMVFVLRGYAGTGKTTFMGGYIKWLDEKKIIHSLLALAGRAAKILSDKTNNEARTKTNRFYKFMSLKSNKYYSIWKRLI